jgi:uncharacterized repeat protein (TIGR03943 family)
MCCGKRFYLSRHMATPALKNTMKKKINNRQLKLSILIAWLLLVFVFIATGKMIIFIRKSYIPISLLTLIITAGLIISVLKNEHESLHPPDWRMFAFFLFPVFMFMLVRPDMLSTFAVANRGVVSNVKVSNAELAKLLTTQVEEEGNYRSLTLKEILEIPDTKINGMKVATEGMVFKNSPPGSFTLVRFLMWCCAADATPLGIPVVWGKTDALKQGMWVRVTGTVTVDKAGAKITGDEIMAVPAPGDPYLY